MTFFGLALLVALAGQGQFDIQIPEHPEDPVVVTGIGHQTFIAEANDLSYILSVVVVGEEDVPPMLGEVVLNGDHLTFTPRFPFLPGQDYEVRVRVASDNMLIYAFTIPANTLPAPKVERVYPTTDVLPQNLLRFYVYFSEPMRVGRTFPRFKLLDASGAEVDQAFVETVPELWNESGTRITLILHPGRVKQGLNMGARYGAVLEEGETYTLQIEDGVPTATGRKTALAYVKTFQVIQGDRQSPDPQIWKLTPPAAGTNHALRIDMSETLDHALLARHLAVFGPNEVVVPGTLTVSLEEKTCFFQPDSKWEDGEHFLRVGAQLEDLAGNQLHMLFDRAATPRREERRPEVIPFRVTSKSR